MRDPNRFDAHPFRCFKTYSRLWFGLLAIASPLVLGCAEDDGQADGTESSGRAEPEGTGEPGSDEAPTYWRDIAPIYARSCVACHQAGGIGVPISNYAEAKAWAATAAIKTQARTMPPWLASSDGTCGEFRDSPALSPTEIETIRRWSEAGAPEGEPMPVTLPDVPELGPAIEYRTPDFLPQVEGGELAKFDEYRCFLIDPGIPHDQMIGAFEFVPGAPAIVHHASVFLLDPEGPSLVPGVSNAEQVTQLDQRSPDRLGWPCYAGAGEGLGLGTGLGGWAPGQGIVEYPAGTGVEMKSGHMLVVQMHYNMADPATHGLRDSSLLRLRPVKGLATSAMLWGVDNLLAGLLAGNPQSLPAGRAEVPYTFEVSYEEMAALGLPPVDIYGVSPHMHELGRKMRLEIIDNHGNAQCGINVDAWDFEWQRMYFYHQPRRFGPGQSLRVTCNYDTSSRTEPVMPGWGTQNEMCFMGLYSVPAN